MAGKGKYDFDFSDKMVLVVEDNPLNQEVAEELRD